MDYVHCEMTHVLQARSNMLCFCFVLICRYPVFHLVYKENSVSRELKTGMCWTSKFTSEAKNAPGLALERVLSSQGHLDGQIQPSTVSFL